MHHSGWAWRVCWRKEKQDQKGVIIVILAPADGKTRLERFNYRRADSSQQQKKNKNTHTFWSIIVCTCAGGRKDKTGKV